MAQPRMTLEGFIALVAAAVLAGGYAASGRGELFVNAALVLGVVVAARVYASLLVAALASMEIARRVLPQQPIEEAVFRVRTVVEWRSRLPALLEAADTPPGSARLLGGVVASKKLVGAGARLTLEYAAAIDFMGVYTGGPLRVEVRDPLGLFAVTIEGWKWMLEVTPRPEPGLDARLAVQEGAAEVVGEEHLMARASRGSEVLFTREAGEDEALEPTSIDWRATARRGRLVVKVFSRGRPGIVWVVYAVDERTAVEHAATLARRALGAFTSLCRMGVEARLLAVSKGSVWEAACSEQGYAARALLKAFIERVDCNAAARLLGVLEGSVIAYASLKCVGVSGAASVGGKHTGDQGIGHD